MLYYAIKLLVSALIILAVSELAKRLPGFAALVASLPLISVLAFVWMHLEGSSNAAVADLSGQIYDSVHQKLLTLPAEVELYPGHTSGSACGAGMSGKPTSTIGYEKRWNPMLALDRAGFVAALTETIPPRPADMDRMVQANLG